MLDAIRRRLLGSASEPAPAEPAPAEPPPPVERTLLSVSAEGRFTLGPLVAVAAIDDGRATDDIFEIRLGDGPAFRCKNHDLSRIIGVLATAANASSTCPPWMEVSRDFWRLVRSVAEAKA